MSWLPRALCLSLSRGLCGLAGLLAASPAQATTQAAEGADAADGGARANPRERQPFSERFGVERLATSLAAPRLAERLAAIQRLARLGTSAALHRLLGVALERRAQLGAREWLTLARELAPHAQGDETRVLLALAMNQRPGEGAGPGEAALLELARGTAALALAASGSDAALRVLGAALRAGGPGAALAADALLAYPPAELDRLLALPGAPSVELARWLGALGDQRAFHPLRSWVRGESAEVRAAAAVALTELGALETVPLARQWLKSNVPVLQRAAVEILVLTHEPEAAAALRAELAARSEPAERLQRALEFPSPELLAAPAEGSSSAYWTLLGRVGGAPALRQLAAGLRDPAGAFAAAHALSRLPGSEGHKVLAEALEARVALPVTSRAAALRTALWQESFASLPERLAELCRSRSPGERAAGAWGSSLLGARAALAELGSGDAARVEAAADNALWFDDEVAGAAAGLLSRAAPGRARQAFAFALLRPSGRRAVSSALLESLVLDGGAAAPLALRVLASRSEPRFDAFAQAYLSHPDAMLRAHVARGLGESARASASGLLARSYEFEADASVRQAIVRGASLRSGPTLRRMLELAASLDPSPKVRAAARLALGGVALGDAPPGNEFLWAELRSLPSGEGEPSPESAAAASAGTAAAEPTERRSAPGGGQAGLLHVAPGLAVPVFADAAGLLVVAGVSLHPLALRWR